jgi:hypothetical protein
LLHSSKENQYQLLLDSTFFYASDSFFNPRFNRMLFSSANLGMQN